MQDLLWPRETKVIKKGLLKIPVSNGDSPRMDPWLSCLETSLQKEVVIDSSEAGGEFKNLPMKWMKD